MINVQTLGTLLRTLQSGDVTARAPASLQPLAPTQAVKAISPESTHAQQTGARDASRGHPRSARPAGEAHSSAGAAGRTGATVASPAVPAGTAAAATALLVEPDANPAAVVTLAAATADEIAPRVDGRAAAPALPASAPPAGLPTLGPSGAASLTLSSAAHLVDTLARLPGGEPIRPPLPLASAAAAPEAIARALQHSIVVSGVFYESHLARWARQRHPEAALRVEPQAWPAASGPVSGAGVPQDEVAAPALPATPASSALPTPEATAGVPDAAPALVRQQLDVLETGQILWRGDLWQGQPATIEITADEAGTDPGQEAVWRTRLALTLPGLGAFEARLALSGQHLHLHLVAADASSATALRDALPALAAALAARALDLAPVRLHHGLRR
ncbi:MAG: flagellar hook-length control protein FliK [Betaproteobacteria bacterium]|nr:flagellar hook-length control protein FliK [Betaproteobacteria bacterium]